MASNSGLFDYGSKNAYDRHGTNGYDPIEDDWMAKSSTVQDSNQGQGANPLGLVKNVKDMQGLFGGGSAAGNAASGAAGAAGGAASAGAGGAVSSAGSMAGGMATGAGGAMAGATGTAASGAGAATGAGASAAAGSATPWGAIIATGLQYKGQMDEVRNKKNPEFKDYVNLAHPASSGKYGNNKWSAVSGGMFGGNLRHRTGS